LKDFKVETVLVQQQNRIILR